MCLPPLEEFAKRIEKMMREAWNKESEKCFTLFIKHMTEITSGAVLPKDFKSEDLQAVLTVAEEMETVPLPSDHLGRLRAEKDLTDLVKCSSEVTNLAKVIKLTFSVLVDGNALDPINPDENLGALVSILFSPSDGVKGLPQFQVFSQLAEARLLSMLRKTLDSVASPLLSRLGARKLLAFVDSKGPELQVDMDLDIDQDTIKSSQKQCEQIVKSFPEWLEKKLPDFGVSMTAAAAEGSGDADQAEDESGLSLAQVRIWMVCFLPKALKTVALCKTCSALEAGLVKDPKVTSSKYQEFLTATASAYAELEEFGSSMTALTLNESDGDGAKIFVTNKFIGIVEAALCRSAQSVVKAAVDVKCKVLQELDEVLSNEELLKTNDLINAGCTEVTMPKLLLVAQSKPSKSWHGLVKEVDSLNEVFAALSAVKDIAIKNDSFDAVKKEVKDATATLVGESCEKGKALNSCLATIQALWRPLKSGETRGQLARRARVMVTSRQVKLPANLDMFLTKMAATPDKKTAEWGEA